jgi:hypothetical protein
VFGIPIVQPTRCTCYLKLFFLVKRSTCFGWSFRPSSELKTAYTATGYVEKPLLLAAIEDEMELQQQLFDVYRCCIRSFELLMMDGKEI